MHFQDLILTLQHYWNKKGCLLMQPYDVETGAGTFNPSTFLRSLGPEPFNAAYVEPSRRPTDGRYGDNPIRLQHYFQFQVVMKPNPDDFLEQYIGSLVAIGIDPHDHDIRFVHDDWESPTLGAWGLGWEVWADGMEVTQFTYFQQVGGLELNPVMGEITYGLERICMFLQQVDNVYELTYNDQFTYGDLFHQNEVRCSEHNFLLADVDLHLELFKRYEAECMRLCDANNPNSAVDYCLKASHTFNILDARGAVSVNERQGYILRVRALARAVSAAWTADRESLGFPLNKYQTTPTDADVTTSAPPSPSSVELPERAPLLLEIGVEEMPAAVFQPLLNQLPQLVEKLFVPAELDIDDIAFFVTPRRLTISFGSVRTRQRDRIDEIKGPPMRVAQDADGNWSKAAVGFATKNGISLDDTEVRTIKDVDYLFATIERPGQAAPDVLATIIPDFLSAIHWYKVMRWGCGTTAFVRPIKWITALLGDHVIPLTYGGIESSRYSRGHRFLSTEPVDVHADRTTYCDTLRQQHVVVDHDERRAMIQHQLQELAAANGLQWRDDPKLLDEVTHLVEYPVPILGYFDEKSLAVPEMVLVSEMRVHQKYFALTRNGKLHNAFIAVSNMKCRDPEIVRRGYEKVLRSRFADAEFFLREDTTVTLAERVPTLAGAIFQTKLGSVLDKVERIKKLTEWLCNALGFDATRTALTLQIAELCKTDLTTDMVGEFPDLQGEVGRYYAQMEGLPDIVADGLRDHYQPHSVNGVLPTSDEAAVVGIADRIDSLTGITGIGKAPTSSADPFALRRACLTSIVIIIGREFHIDISELIRTSITLYEDRLDVAPDALHDQLLDFFLTRGSRLLHELERDDIPSGFARDSVQAVIGARTSWYDFTDLVQRIEAMDIFRQRDDFADVATTFKRCNNILKDDSDVDGVVDSTRFTEPQETEMAAAIATAEAAIVDALDTNDYVAALAAVAPLRITVDTFFDAVLINDDDPDIRTNRRRLVQAVVNLVIRVADFSVVQTPDTSTP